MVEILGMMFKECFPEDYEKLKPAFNAWQWLPENPGPWIARAVIFKLQGTGHCDQDDI